MAPIAVDLSALKTCEALLQHGPLPDAKATDDARAAFFKDDAALIDAHKRMDAGRDCTRDVRGNYSKGK